MNRRDVNCNQKEQTSLPGRTRTFSIPDQDSFKFMFTKSKFGFLRVSQCIFTLISWTLSLHFKQHFIDEDRSLFAFFLFATIVSWLYSIFSIAISLVVMQRRSHDLIRRITIICSCLTCAVFCLITSSLLGDYVRRLKADTKLCDSIKSTSCGYLQTSVVFGFLAMISFTVDASYELYILKEIRETALVPNDVEKLAKSRIAK